MQQGISLIQLWNNASIDERFEFLLELDKRYKGNKDANGKGIYHIWVSFIRQCGQDDQDDKDENLDKFVRWIN
jgi:hypothetical protein